MAKSKKMTQVQFMAKIIAEGGIGEALDYGLTASDLGDEYQPFKGLWAALEAAYGPVAAIMEDAEEEIDDECDEEDDDA